MKKKLFLQILFVLFVLTACKKADYRNETTNPPDYSLSQQYKSNNSGHLKIAVLSDIHYMHPSLFQNNAEAGAPYQEYLMKNFNKTLQTYSVPIFDKVLAELEQEKPDIVLIAGDMAKDGEKISHEAVAMGLQQLRNMGSKVYVVPGNNDINNPDATAFDGNNPPMPVAKVTPVEFATIYSDFGYGNAISKDGNSLSYVAAPYPDLWILAIDAAKYYYDPPKRSGAIKPQTMQWIKERMAEARQQNITVLGLMHYNLLEHFDNQNGITPATVIDNWTTDADALIGTGLEVVFTGHSHATDIAKRVTNGKAIYDIETGSLVTPPSPYRILTLKNKELDISTSLVTEVNATFPENQSLTEYGNATMTKTFDAFFTKYLTQAPFSLSNTLAASTAPLIREAYRAHIMGDEKIMPQQQVQIDALNSETPKPTFMISALNSLWTDPNTKDLKWHIKLSER